MTTKAIALLVAGVATTMVAAVVAIVLSHGGDMTVLSSLKRLLGLGGLAGAATEGAKPKREELFVYVKIPASIQPLERASRFEDPLQAALERARLGEVSGGGSMLSAKDAEGRQHIEYCGIDVDLNDAEPGLALLHRELARLQVPEGTVLEYERDGKEYEVPIARQ